MNKLVCVDDFEKLAFRILNKNTLDYYRTGADEEFTLADNKAAFKRWAIRPRMLKDVAVRNLTTTVLGKKVGIPIGISPAALQKLAHEDGEIGNAKAAEALNTIYILSTVSTIPLEEVAAATPRGRKWFQLYMYKNREISINLIKRAEAAGFEAVVLTVDVPYLGKRRANTRDNFTLPKHLRMANFEPFTPKKSDSLKEVANKSHLELIRSTVDLMDRSLTWDDFDWLRSITRLPILVKGIMTPEDANIAIEHGAAAIFVSNHGGRQLDTVPATIDVLEGIVKSVNGRCDVFFDGGVRLGSDVYKALALGANMVFAGRPLLWGLAVGGEQGAKRILEILRDELDLTMALAGSADVRKIDRKAVVRYSSL